MSVDSLQRFVTAQEGVFEAALGELRGGSKRGHWIWFIFPQLAGLGRSANAQFFALDSVAEARGYLQHPILGPRLAQCVDALLAWQGRRSAMAILGSVDATKVRSSMTLFDRVSPGTSFALVLQAFYRGERDELTLALLAQRQ